MKQTDPDHAGFVLPAVLAILVVLAAGAAVVVQQMQVRTTTTAMRLEGLRLQGFADGALRLVALSLLTERVRHAPGLGLPVNGTAVACSLQGRGLIRIAVQDQAGLLDLNRSPRPLLEDAMRALGVPDGDALTVAAQIIDYRSPGDDPQPNGGAKAPQYRALGLPYGPRNAPFVSVDELDLLPAMTPAIAATLRSAVTIWNPDGGFDPTVSPTPALTQGVAGETLRRSVRASSGRYFDIRVTVETSSGSRAGRQAILSLAGGVSGHGLVSSRPWTPSSPSAEVSDPPACARIARVLVAP